MHDIPQMFALRKWSIASVVPGTHIAFTREQYFGKPFWASQRITAIEQRKQCRRFELHAGTNGGLFTRE